MILTAADLGHDERMTPTLALQDELLVPLAFMLADETGDDAETDDSQEDADEGHEAEPNDDGIRGRGIDGRTRRQRRRGIRHARAERWTRADVEEARLLTR